jgi:hypothetical protein
LPSQSGQAIVKGLSGQALFQRKNALRRIDARTQLKVMKRLGNDVVGPGFKGSNGILNVRFTRDDDDVGVTA